MKRFFKVALTIIILIPIILWGLTEYLKYSLKNNVTENKLNQFYHEINSTPRLPQSFLDTYSKVYPDIFKHSFNSIILNTILGNNPKQCPSQMVANRCWFFNDKNSEFTNNLYYAAFVWTLEDNISQEKCLEYYVSHFDFLYNAIGINNAALKYYNKTLSNLTREEQLEIILMLENPSLYNKILRPELLDKDVKQLNDKINNRP